MLRFIIKKLINKGADFFPFPKPQKSTIPGTPYLIIPSLGWV
jgi:hypothetical protein